MRKVLCMLMLFCATIGMAQTSSVDYEQRIDSLMTKIDTLMQENNRLLARLDVDLSLKARYKLYQTENIYNLLELDTQTGKIKQVQWSLDAHDFEGSVYINAENLSYWHEEGAGIFELYPTKNMYQFILLDKTTGRKWHVQWGMDAKERWIRHIW